MNGIPAVVVVLAVACVSGCTHLGPQTIPQDRMDYSAAVGDSWQQQQLLNLVRLRYADTPVFLDVGQIVSGYTFESSLNANLAYAASNAPDKYRFGANLGGTGSYANRPTITYTPLTGATFIRGLMAPIPPAAILYAIQSGWPAEIILRTCVKSINGLQNRVVTASFSHAGDPGFYRLTELIQKIQAADAVEMRIVVEKDKGETTLLLFRRQHVTPELQAASAEVRKLLGLPADGHEFKVIYGEVASAPDEIALLSRSLVKIMIALCAYIDVPASHIESGRTIGVPDEPEAERLMRISCGRIRPVDAFVAVPYLGYWYWIKDGDFRSKRAFSFLMLLYSLAETGVKAELPIVTIPAQ